MKRMIPILLAATVILALPVVAQNVGVGTNNPTRAKLEVIGVFTGGATAALFGSNNAGISIQRNWPTVGFNQYRDLITAGSQGKYMSNGYAALHTMDPASGVLFFDMFASGTANTSTTAGVRAITIANNGNTSIRGSHTGASLVVARGDGYEGTAVFQGYTHSSHFNYSPGENTYIRGGEDESIVYINKIPTGSILLGATTSKLGINNPGENPFYTIEIKYTSGKAFTLVDALNKRWSMELYNEYSPVYGNGAHLRLSYNNAIKGVFHFWEGSYGSGSDRKLKKDIEPLGPVLDKIKRLRPMRYELIRNNPDHQKSIGLIAQDVQPIFPQLVRRVTDQNHKTGVAINDALVMEYSGFGVVAIKALQEQLLQIKALEKEREELLRRMEAIEAAFKE